MRDATAALALGTTYDPIEYSSSYLIATSRRSGVDDSIPDIARARLWYRVAKDFALSQSAKVRSEYLPAPSSPHTCTMSASIAATIKIL